MLATVSTGVDASTVITARRLVLLSSVVAPLHGSVNNHLIMVMVMAMIVAAVVVNVCTLINMQNIASHVLSNAAVIPTLVILVIIVAVVGIIIIISVGVAWETARARMKAQQWYRRK